jgi:tetratricopeptide (TPR) repeat protein
MIRSQKELAEVRQPVEQLTQSEKMMLRYEESRDWFAHNRPILIGAVVALIAIVGGLWWWSIQKKESNERAATYLSRVLNYYMAGDYQHAIEGDKTKKVQGDPVYGLRYIVTEFGSTEAGNQAALALGNAYYYLGRYDSASWAFDKASSDFPLTRASIEAGRAAILEQKGNKEEAAKLFESAAKRDKNNPLNADYTLSAARDLQQAGKKEDATRLYKELLENYPSTQFDDAAKRALLQMNVQL